MSYRCLKDQIIEEKLAFLIFGFILICLRAKNLDFSLCHLSYEWQFVWYPGYHGYQFSAALATSI